MSFAGAIRWERVVKKTLLLEPLEPDRGNARVRKQRLDWRLEWNLDDDDEEVDEYTEKREFQEFVYVRMNVWPECWFVVTE